MTARRYTEEQFRAVVAEPEVRTIADLCRALGLVPRGGNYESLRAYAAALDIELPQHEQRGRPHAAPRPRRSYTDEELLDALERCRNYPELCRALGLRPVSGTYRRLPRRAEQLGTPIPESWSRPGRRGPEGDVRERAPHADPRPPARPRREYEVAALRDAVAQARTRRDARHCVTSVTPPAASPTDGSSAGSSTTTSMPPTCHATPRWSRSSATRSAARPGQPGQHDETAAPTHRRGLQGTGVRGLRQTALARTADPTRARPHER